MQLNLLAGGWNLNNSIGDFGGTVLNTAILYQQEYLVAWLLKNGAHADFYGQLHGNVRYNIPPLRMAVISGNPAMVRLVLEHGGEKLSKYYAANHRAMQGKPVLEARFRLEFFRQTGLEEILPLLEKCGIN